MLMSIIATDENGNEHFSTGSKTITFFQVDPTMNQDQLQKNLEEKQLRAFKDILDRQGSKYNFTTHERGVTDPPDFFIHRGNKVVGLELTTITDGEIASSASKLPMVKDFFLTQYQAGKFKKIKGLGVMLDIKGQVPRKMTDGFKKKLMEVVDFLDGLHVPENFLQDYSRSIHTSDVQYPFSESFESENINVWVESYGSGTNYEMGFKLDIHLPLHSDLEDIQKLIEDAIKRKDSPKNQELLIVVGGPNNRGVGNPMEAYTMKYFLSKWLIKLDKPVYLKRVFVLLFPFSKIYSFDFVREQKHYRFDRKKR